MDNNNKFFYFDHQYWPLVILTIHEQPKSEMEMKIFLESWGHLYTKCMLNGQRYKLIFDVRKSPLPQIRYLKLLGEWLVNVKSLTEKWMDRTAIIVKENGMKFMIDFVFKVYKAVRPFKVFGEFQIKDAQAWLENTDDIGDLKNYTERSNQWKDLSLDEFEKKIKTEYLVQ
jgi:hypothetical protein